MFGSSYFASTEFGSEQPYSTPSSINTSGIASAETFGSATLTFGAITITGTGIPTASALGTPTVQFGVKILSPTAIGSSESFGSPAVTYGVLTLYPTGIASAQAFGSADVVMSNATLSPASIASLEAFGQAIVTREEILAVVGIPTHEAFGTPRLTVFDVSFTPTNPDNTTVWVGYDETADQTTITPQGSTPTGVWVADGTAIAGAYAANDADSPGSWVVN